MTDYREINAIAKDPARAKLIAASLLAIPTLEWTDWERDFLDHMTLRDEELTTRQAEKLVELRDDSKHYEKVDGFVLHTLVDKCFIYRCELNEHDAEFIERKKASGQGRFLRRDASRICGAPGRPARLTRIRVGLWSVARIIRRRPHCDCRKSPKIH